MTNWKELIEAALKENGEGWTDVVDQTLNNEQMVEKFNNGFGGTNGRSFSLWTKNRVYFPICYDGAEWVGSASRNPDGKPLDHQGG